MHVPFVFGPADLRLCDVAMPTPGPADVVLRVGAVGVCGSDLSMVAAGGPLGPTDHPVPLGHELSGTVIAAGNAVRHLAVGDRVVVNPLVNMIGNGGPEGGFAEQLLIRDVVARPGSLLKLPEAISLDQGALVEPLAVAAHAINRLGAVRGDTVAVFGAGPIGLACLVVLRARGVEDIVVFEPSPFRRGRAEQLGAAVTVDPGQTSAAEALSAAHGKVPLFSRTAAATTHFLEASGAPVLSEILALARQNARICVVSVPKSPVTIDLATLTARELTLIGSLGYPSEFPAVLAMLEAGLAAGTIDLAPLVSHRFQGTDVLDAFATAGRPDQSAKVLVRYDN